MNSSTEEPFDANVDNEKTTLLNSDGILVSTFIRVQQGEDNSNEKYPWINTFLSASHNGSCGEGVTSYCSEWSDLPTPSVENIYHFLSRTDQYRMSLVCSRWSEGYGSPSIWKTVKFYLPEQEYSEELFPEVENARKYGHMFRNVEIICKRIRKSLLRTILDQLKLFLQSLSSCTQLSSVKFINMGKYFRCLDGTMFSEVFWEIYDFLLSQKKLKVAEFVGCNFSFRESSIILSALLPYKNSIEHLKLRGFVNDGLEGRLKWKADKPFSSINVNALLFFNVHCFEADYTLLFSTLVTLTSKVISNTTLPRFYNFALSKLSIYCEGSRHSDWRLTSSIWREIISFCPDLKVELYFTAYKDVSLEATKLIVKDMPLRTLDLRFYKHCATPWTELDEIFELLVACECHRTLEVVDILWIPPVSDLFSTVSPFLLACESLHTFRLNSHSPADGIEALFEFLIEERPVSLKTISLQFNSIKYKRERENLQSLADEYYPRLKNLNIEMSLIIHSGGQCLSRQ